MPLGLSETDHCHTRALRTSLTETRGPQVRPYVVVAGHGKTNDDGPSCLATSLHHVTAPSPSSLLSLPASSAVAAMAGLPPLLLLLLMLPVFCFCTNVYIVYMGEKLQLDEEGEQLVRDHHVGMLTSLLGSEDEAKRSIIYSYRHSFSGFAASMSSEQANSLADLAGVVRVVPNRMLKLHTTRSWDFLYWQDAGEHSATALRIGHSGLKYDPIIGVLDTGIWPESESFRDDGIGEVPRRWKGECIGGDKFSVSNCNRKIIGARWYIKGYEADNGKLNTSDIFEFLSPRDAVGHGTHTASIAAGVPVANASFMGLASGVAKGGAPSARLAVYKVCWATGDCSSADILAAFDDAIHDGVDVLSVSLGQSPPIPAYVDDILAVGSFHAVSRGVTVVCSAGNSGPFSETVINGAPWVISVAASTIDRTFLSAIILGNNMTYVGETLYLGSNQGKAFPLVNSEDIAANNSDSDDARGCNTGSLNSSLVRGKVVLCFQTRIQRSIAVAADTVAKSRGVGVLFAQFLTKDIPYSVDAPSIQVDLATGTAILAYIGLTRSPVVQFGSVKTVLGKLKAPEVAYFSSRGPSSLSPFILKPDVTAPGVNILASWSPAALLSPNVEPVKFKIESGTSMSCPHISGIAAMIKAAHPSWSPAAIRSALVTTADVEDAYGLKVVAEAAPHKEADWFDYGGGHVNPNRAMEPGLVYDMGVADYITFLCSMGYNNSAISLMTEQRIVCPSYAATTCRSRLNLNLPSITIPELSIAVTVTRSVTNVGPTESTYVVHVEKPPGVGITVRPSTLLFNATASRLKFKVTFKPVVKVQGGYTFGSLTWINNHGHSVRIPISVRTIVDHFYAES